MIRRVVLLVAGLALGLVAPLPAAAETVFQDGFESGDLSEWDNVATSRYTVTDDPDRVHSGGYALQGTIPPDEGWGELNKWFLPGYGEIYVRFDVMFEKGFQNLRSDGNGMHFFSVAGNRVDDRWSSHGQAGIVPDGSDFFATTVDPEHSYGDPALEPLGFYTYYPDMTCCYGNLFLQDAPAVPLTDGVWHEIVVHVDAGTPGMSDGSQRMWIDGRLVIDVGGIRWRDTDELRLNEIAVVNYMPGSPREQRIWFDNFLVTTEFPGTGPMSRFSDVPTGHAFHDEIEWLASEGITLGCDPPVNSVFCPGDPVTRGQMAAFLVRALDLPPGEAGRFADDDGSVFQADIEALASEGITLGCDPPVNSVFCPGDPVTRGQMAAFLVRALDLPPGEAGRFSDDDGSVFQADIEALAEAGITLGCDPPVNSVFCPDDPVTRGQMAAFLFRALGRS